MEDSTLSTYVARDGDNIAIQDWPLSRDQPLRGVVLIVHGLGEHAGRYEVLARRLNAWGFAVRGYDHYGHGDSGGARGGLPGDNRLLHDLADVLESTRARMSNATPLILFGHSMGALVAARVLSLGLGRVQGLVLSSPALKPKLNAWQKVLLKVMLYMAPNWPVSNGLKPQLISHDPAVVQAYQRDKLVHDRITARLGQFIVQAGAATLAHAAKWTTPTLLLYAGQDHLVDANGSRTFAAQAPAKLVQAHCYEGYYHEIFNELDAEPVFTRLQRWLDGVVPAKTASRRSRPPAAPSP